MRLISTKKHTLMQKALNLILFRLNLVLISNLIPQEKPFHKNVTASQVYIVNLTSVSLKRNNEKIGIVYGQCYFNIKIIFYTNNIIMLMKLANFISKSV
ncbi:hypothetical protein PPBDW_II0887 [Photobacterium kishitanii]|nr:hypothetical protein PPBDW_II0887 [Photobacterium kishitanii]